MEGLPHRRWRARWHRSKDLSIVPFMVGIFIFLQVVARLLVQIPILRFLERSICRSHYLSVNPSVFLSADDSIKEELCKAAPVQIELSTLFGWFGFWNGLCALAAALPYLYLGERVDRRLLVLCECVTWIVGLAFVYCVCYFDDLFNIKMIYLSSLSFLLGGSTSVASSFLYAILAESVPTTSLSKCFFYISAALFVGRVGAFSAVASLMHVELWIPVQLGFAIVTCSLPLLLIIPEPRKLKKTDIPDDQPLLSDDNSMEGTPTREAPPSVPAFGTDSNYTDLKEKVVSNAKAARSLLVNSPSAGICLAIYFLYNLGVGISSILTQWASKYHGWSLIDVNYIISLTDGVAGITLMVLPTIGKNLRTRISGTATDLLIAKGSLIAALGGTLCIALSSSRLLFILALAVFRLGSGFPDALKAYLTATNPKNFVTSLYVAIAVMADVAGFVGAPIWAGIMNLGLSSGAKAFGSLPFWASSVCLALAVALLLKLDMGKEGGRSDSTNCDEGDVAEVVEADAAGPGARDPPSH